MSKTKITDYKTERINKLTGGTVQPYKIPDYPTKLKDNGVLNYSFVSKDGQYIGDYDRAWWYVKNNLKVCDEHPIGVAEVYKDDKMVGYHGYSHRGGNTFKIGDRLFDQRYLPLKEDYEKSQWDKWEAEYLKKWEEGDEFDREMIYTDISVVIPFNMRGHKQIETMEEARQAAINMSNYLS